MASQHNALGWLQSVDAVSDSDHKPARFSKRRPLEKQQVEVQRVLIHWGTQVKSLSFLQNEGVELNQRLEN